MGVSVITVGDIKSVDFLVIKNELGNIVAVVSPNNLQVGTRTASANLHVSGVLTVGSGTVKITSNDVQFGSSARLELNAAGDLRFFDTSNPSGASLGGGGSVTPASSVVVETSYGLSSAVGTSADYARADHSHGSPSLGTTAATACAGNDSRLSDSRVPSGSAAGDLSGTYPNPGVAKVAGVTPGTTGLALLDDATAYAARNTIELSHVALGIDWYGWAARMTAQNFAPLHAASGLAHNNGAGTATSSTRGRRIYKRPLSAAAPAAGTLVGGMSGNTTEQTLLASSAFTWTVYFFIATTSTVAIRGGFGVSNNNAVDNARVATQSIGIRYRPDAGDTDWNAYSTNGTPTTTASTLGVAFSADTIYVGRIVWNGTSAAMAMATINATTGLWGTFSTPVTISTNLPTSTLGLCPVSNWYVQGAPGVAQSIDLGGAFILPGVS